MRSMDEAPEPRWLVVAIARWRRYGDGGQELRPGTKVYRGGARVFVIDTYPGMGSMDLTTVGQARDTGHWITIDTATRHLHTFRAKLVHSPPCCAGPRSGGPRTTPRSAHGSGRRAWNASRPATAGRPTRASRTPGAASATRA